jgi:hypothetical protein
VSRRNSLSEKARRRAEREAHAVDAAKVHEASQERSRLLRKLAIMQKVAKGGAKFKIAQKAKEKAQERRESRRPD